MEPRGKKPDAICESPVEKGVSTASSASDSERQNEAQTQAHLTTLHESKLLSELSRRKSEGNQHHAAQSAQTSPASSFPIPSGDRWSVGRAGDREQELPDYSSSLHNDDEDSSEIASKFSSSRSATHPALSRAPIKRDDLRSSTQVETESLRSTASSELADGEATMQIPERAARIRPSEPSRPDPLSFLEHDSPSVTQDSILHAIAQASEEWSPRSVSSFGSISSRPSIAETDTTTPDQSVGGCSPPATALPRPSQLHGKCSARTGSPKPKNEPSARRPQLHPHLDGKAQDRYGTPEMARGSAKHPHFPPNELQPRLVAPGQGYPKYLPRAEKLPMSGYEQVAAKLSTAGSPGSRRGSNSSSQSDGEAAIKPIYRKFEALNHRLLLHLQDELSELEEQLHRLDTADTQTRRLQNCILPASRRAEFMAGGELQWRKTDILGKIGFKLGQYNHALNSFTKTLNLPPASLGDIEDYRTYLATHNPIAEIETRFLDVAEDLICLDPDRPVRYPRPPSPSQSLDGLLTPVPHRTGFGSNRSARHSRPTSISPSPNRESFSPRQDMELRPPPGERPQSFPAQAAQTTAGRQPQTEDPREGPRLEAATPNASNSSIQTLAAHQHVHALTQVQAALLASLAILLPTLVFPLITDFAARFAVVFVAGLAVSAVKRRIVEAGFSSPGPFRGVAECRSRHGDGEIDENGGGSGKGWVVGLVYGMVMFVLASIV